MRAVIFSDIEKLVARIPLLARIQYHGQLIADKKLDEAHKVFIDIQNDLHASSTVIQNVAKYIELVEADK